MQWIMYRRWLMVACWVSLVTLTAGLSGCEGANDLITGALTTNPDALKAAEVGGNATAGLEVALIGAGLLTELPAGQLPSEALSVAEAALNGLISDCLTFQAIDGVAGVGTGFDIQFASGGCGIPATNINLKGGLKVTTLATDTTSSWFIGFTQFEVAGVFIDGTINVEVKDKTSLSFDIVDLDASYSGSAVKVSLKGDLTTNTAHTDVTFSGAGAVVYGGTTYAFTATNIERHTTSDCYPEKGALSLTIITADGKETSAGIAFSDLVLDSDDSGKVYVTLNGEQHTAKLPARLCTGF
jgi:hypothetical protein